MLLSEHLFTDTSELVKRRWCLKELGQRQASRSGELRYRVFQKNCALSRRIVKIMPAICWPAMGFWLGLAANIRQDCTHILQSIDGPGRGGGKLGKNTIFRNTLQVDWQVGSCYQGFFLDRGYMILFCISMFQMIFYLGMEGASGRTGSSSRQVRQMVYNFFVLVCFR